jgi:hypothetical protein
VRGLLLTATVLGLVPPFLAMALVRLARLRSA